MHKNCTISKRFIVVVESSRSTARINASSCWLPVFKQLHYFRFYLRVFFFVFWQLITIEKKSIVFNGGRSISVAKLENSSQKRKCYCSGVSLKFSFVFVYVIEIFFQLTLLSVVQQKSEEQSSFSIGGNKCCLLLSFST